jgi:hypothetical protein
VTGNPVHPSQLIGKIYQHLGIGTDARLPHPEGRDVRVMSDPAETARANRVLASLT